MTGSHGFSIIACATEESASSVILGAALQAAPGGLTVTAVTLATKVGAANDVIFPESANSPKNSASFSCGASRANSVREAACSGPAARPLNNPSAT
jgi:hypothetical protein